jgi:hypothetical protein
MNAVNVFSTFVVSCNKILNELCCFSYFFVFAIANTVSKMAFYNIYDNNLNYGNGDIAAGFSANNSNSENSSLFQNKLENKITDYRQNYGYQKQRQHPCGAQQRQHPYGAQKEKQNNSSGCFTQSYIPYANNAQNGKGMSLKQGTACLKVGI